MIDYRKMVLNEHSLWAVKLLEKLITNHHHDLNYQKYEEYNYFGVIVQV